MLRLAHLQATMGRRHGVSPLAGFVEMGLVDMVRTEGMMDMVRVEET